MTPFDRSSYGHWTTMPTRWSDNDQFGHVNNAVHYSVMDTTINNWLKAHGFDVAAGGDTINLIPETGCRYLAEISYPDVFEVGLRALGVGRTSVRWECALLRARDGEAVAIATSGSTGTPKLSLLTAANLIASAEATAQRLGGHGQWLLALPPHHIGGLQVLLRSIAAGTKT